MRKTEFAFWTFLMMAGLAGVTTVLNVTNGNSANSPNAELYRQLDLFGLSSSVSAPLRREAGRHFVIENAINGMLTALDPHSSYLSPKTSGHAGPDARRIRRPRHRGHHGKRRLKVVSPIDETPALRPASWRTTFITHLDNEQINGLTLEQAVEKMRGPVNTRSI